MYLISRKLWLNSGRESVVILKGKRKSWDSPGGTVVKNVPANAGDMGSSPGLGRSHRPWSN